MLFIISDGQPNDDGYSGTAAEADLRGIKLEYSRRGVEIFAAAIGSDREQIERNMESIFKGKLGMTPNAKAVAIGELPRSEKKTQRIFDNRY